LLLKYAGIWAVAVLFVLVQGTTVLIRRRQATRA
jgi:hypothetical protein